MTFSEWFKKEYPLQDTLANGGNTEFKTNMRKAWNAAANECLRAIRSAPGDKAP